MPSHKKGATGRNFAAEYAARVARAAARGFGLPVARGHPRAGEPGLKDLKERSTVKRVFDAIRGYEAQPRGAKSLERAARAASVSPSTVKRRGLARGILSNTPLEPEGGGPKAYRIYDRGSMPVLDQTLGLVTGEHFDTPTMSLLGRYWNAVENALLDNNEALLAPFRNATIVSTAGNEYNLVTELDAVREIMNRFTEEDQAAFDASFQSEKALARREGSTLGRSIG